MKTAIIKTTGGKVVAMLVQQPELSDKDYEDLVAALMITLCNWTGLQLAREETGYENQ